MVSNIKISGLRCEYLTNPLGIDVKEPRLSWVMDSPKRGEMQAAYRIIVSTTLENLSADKGDLWDSGKVSSDSSNQVEYSGESLSSEIKCYWKVKIWDNNDDASDWSEGAFWTMGLLEKDSWSAKWIGSSPKDVVFDRAVQKKRKQKPKFEEDPSQMLRKSFVIDEIPERASVYVTALDQYELYLNGNRVGDHYLAPEWTDYYERVLYQTYDVADLLQKGENVLAVYLADGWYIGHLGPGGVLHNFYGKDRRLLLKLSLFGADGNKTNISTDETWKLYEDGPIRRADHFTGEWYDSRKEVPGWDLANFDDSDWKNAFVDNKTDKTLSAQMNEPIRIANTLKAVSFHESKPGVWVYDIGQNIAGWVKIRLNSQLCEKDAKITIRHGEMLNLDKTLYTENLRFAKATEEFIYNGQEEVEYHPRFTYHGFQYVEVSGLRNGVTPSLDMITGCLIASDPPRVGAFESSDKILNKLWSNIRWTQWDNMISVPTDCPQRNERMGWMGDAQVFCQTSMFNLDMSAFYTKWSRDIRDDQTDEGKFTDYVPFPERDENGKKLGRATPAWADCGVIVPWRMYENYGDKRILMEHYSAVKKYIDFLSENNPKFLWKNETGASYNDWLNGNKIKSKDYPKKGAAVPKPVFATAYFAYSTQILANMANILGKDEDFQKYSELATNIRNAFNKKFVKKNGKIKGDTQAGYAIALNFDLLPEDKLDSAVKHMANAIKKYDYRISTGFCSTPLLMKELSKRGLNDIAYRLLLSHRFPSWFYMIDQGATSMWERWDGYVKGRGFQSTGMNSFNHYSIGAVGEWMYRVMLGINFDTENPGYKHIIIKPMPGGTIKWVKGSYDSIFGKITSEWKVENKKISMKISIPPNTSATVYIPAINSDCVLESGKSIKENSDILSSKFVDKAVALEIGSGSYDFETEIE